MLCFGIFQDFNSSLWESNKDLVSGPLKSCKGVPVYEGKIFNPF
jgi:hypothetical protein